MKAIFTILITSFPFLCLANSLDIKDLSPEQIESRLDISGAYSGSTDVLYGKVLRKFNVSEKGKKCQEEVSEIEVIESFKGTHEKGEKISVWGIDAHELITKGSEQLLFLNYYRPDERDLPSYSSCVQSMFKNYLQIHNWCCSIIKIPTKSNVSYLIAYDMITSETKTENYLVKSEPAFNLLRALKQKEL